MRPAFPFRSLRLACWLLLAAVLLSACTAPAPQAAAAATAPAATATRRALPTLAPQPQTMECLMVSAPATPAATSESLFPPPGAQDHATGPADAAVTFLVYTDPQTPAAAALDQVLAALLEKYPAALRRVQRAFPLPANDKSLLAAAAAEAAARQDRYWEMSAALFASQAEWSGLDEQAFLQWLSAAAAGLELDLPRFEQDMNDPELQSAVSAAQRFGLESGISYSPFVLINGEIYQGPRDERSLENLVNLLRMETLQFSDCPPFVIDVQKDYTAVLETTRGRIVVQLFPKEAPLAVNNFVFLARQGWYTGVDFHRVIAGKLAQSGDPSGSGYGSPGYAFPDEIGSLKFDRPGLLAMANAGPDSNGSQFFLTARALPELDGQHTIFGQVLEGLEVLAALTPRDPSLALDLAAADRILKVTIEEN